MNHNPTAHHSPGPLAYLHRLQRYFLWFVLVALCPSIAACSGNDTMPLSVVGYNHTNRDIGAFYVNDSGGPYLGKHEGGGNFTCCIALPKQYKPGMTVKVGWSGLEVGEPQQRTVVVPRYGPHDGGMLAVHFLRNGQVKVFVTMLMSWHPDYPLKGDEAKM
ncbi:DUF3304 domain-containing protein [Paraburkholderia bonniea]|uniref:DUF3304 domain-containing protein n=1 Tax=Paraburkholderia bonniea TaxID=2152891 RepID=UPI001291B599|nr:DUF3304 domain-containing protein [Paraburkholderia bonniea]